MTLHALTIRYPLITIRFPLITIRFPQLPRRPALQVVDEPRPAEARMPAAFVHGIRFRLFLASLVLLARA